MTRLKKAACLLIFILFLLGMGHLYYSITGDFQLSYLIEASSAFSNAPVQENIKTILKQHYTYLGQGHQSFAFLSSDKQYVLKFFKKNYFKSTPWIHVFPPILFFKEFFLLKGTAKEERFLKVLNGYQIAYTFLPKESGLIYYHPKSTSLPWLKTTLFSGLGFKIPINLNHYTFAIQTYVTTTKQELIKLLSKGNIEEAKKRITALIALYQKGYNQGIFDRDHNFLDNTGFYKGQAIRQDVGKIIKKKAPFEASLAKKDLFKVLNQRLIPWIQKNYPHYTKEVKNLIESHLLKDQNLPALRSLPTSLTQDFLLTSTNLP